MWYLLYFLLLLGIGVSVYLTYEKVRKEIYNPYFLRPMMLFFSAFGVVFLVVSLLFLFRI